MALAMRRDGIDPQVVSGHRTFAEQTALYRAYIAGTGNLAARPGTSRHEYGQAVDVQTGDQAENPPIVLWLREHGAEYGFAETVPTERWHWQYLGSDMDERINMGSINDWWKDLRVLKLGERHDGVELMQRALIATGYDPGPVDGIWGSKTKAAFTEWETVTYPNATSDGLPGPHSWKRLLAQTLDSTGSVDTDTANKLADALAKLSRVSGELADANAKLKAARAAAKATLEALS